MKLSALIQGKRPASSLRPATANLAKVAKDDAKQVDILPRLAGLATLALATAGVREILDDFPFPDSEPIKAALPAQSAPCYNCHSSDFWESALTGDLICRKCHPPAVAKLEQIAVTLPTVATEEELMEMIRGAYSELDALRDWTGWRQSLSADHRCQLQAHESQIDTSYAAEDKDALKSALCAHRNLHFYYGGSFRTGSGKSEGTGRTNSSGEEYRSRRMLAHVSRRASAGSGRPLEWHTCRDRGERVLPQAERHAVYSDCELSIILMNFYQFNSQQERS